MPPQDFKISILSVYLQAKMLYSTATKRSDRCHYARYCMATDTSATKHSIRHDLDLVGVVTEGTQGLIASRCKPSALQQHESIHMFAI